MYIFIKKNRVKSGFLGSGAEKNTKSEKEKKKGENIMLSSLSFALTIVNV